MPSSPWNISVRTNGVATHDDDDDDDDDDDEDELLTIRKPRPIFLTNFSTLQHLGPFVTI